ncbi:hypothetical protein BpHYR1_045810 [Brachionus plicatilis]|uniref:Uncharacterized protein n=1 Tax=Brachionus plicatilis TaxID=10195 RepID=A0A3M7SYL2_BRAPC|nr:hypothetical protein BpHYR1_045810 [Brachionus plicatilis]
MLFLYSQYALYAFNMLNMNKNQSLNLHLTYDFYTNRLNTNAKIMLINHSFKISFLFKLYYPEQKFSSIKTRKVFFSH